MILSGAGAGHAGGVTGPEIYAKAELVIASGSEALAPYAGLYADYYFSRDDGPTDNLTTLLLLQGWSARVTGSVTATLAGGASLGAGGELGGIGSVNHIWSWTVRGRLPFYVVIARSEARKQSRGAELDRFATPPNDEIGFCVNLPNRATSGVS